jgi:WD40 repeat protein/transcriptional regulator with XRE-family HTH domain
MRTNAYKERDYRFGQDVLSLRNKISLTQAELANELGLSRHAIGEWETGSSYPKVQPLKALIALAVQQRAFTAGREAEEIRAFWKAAHQKVLLDEMWLSSLLEPLHSPHLHLVPQAIEENMTVEICRNCGMSQPNCSCEPLSAPKSRVDWGDALAIPTFYGREEEQTFLSQWIQQERCRVVSVLGMGGIGKSALVVKTMYHLAEDFEVVIFRSLRDAPALDALLDDCLQVLSPEPLSALPATLKQRTSLLLSLFRTHRALVVLDNLESLLVAGEVRGHFRPGFEGYGQLLRRVAETGHQSCLLFTSREKPIALRSLEGTNSSARSLRLAGLGVVACQQILEDKGIALEVGTQPEQENLIGVYSGNPLALKIVAETIRDLFGGEIGTFLGSGTVLFGSINDLLDQQFTRLSLLERRVLYWLVIMRESVTLEELLALLLSPLPFRQVLLEAVDSLHRRGLIERGKRSGSFTLQSVVLEYVTLVLITEVSEEIQQHQLDRLIQHGLSQATAREYVRQTQERLLLSPLLTELQRTYSAPTQLETQLLSLLDKLRGWEDLAQGYGPANLIALLRLHRGNLNGLDLSSLSIRGAYLQSVEMHDTSLFGVLIRDTVLTEAIRAIWSVAVSLDERWWAAGSEEGKVRVWEEGSQTLRLIWQAHAYIVYSLAFSPDGRTLASGSWDNTVKLWDVESGALLWMGWQKYPYSLAFTPDGSLLASGGADATVRLWDPHSGTALQTLTHPSSVHAIAFSPGGQWLASGCSDGVMRLWERHKTGFSTWVEIHSMQTSWVMDLAFAPDGGTLASAHFDPSDRTVKLWDVGSLRLLHTLPELQGRHIAWSPDGRVLAGYSDRTIFVFDVEQGRIHSTLHGHTAEVYSLTFAPDSTRLLSGSADGMLRVWNVASGQCVRVIAGYGVTLIELGWSPDGTHLVSGGTDTLVTLWDVSGETVPKVLRGHTMFVSGVGWSPDGRFVVSCGLDAVMFLWDPTSHALVQRYEDSSAPLLCVAWSPDGHLLARGTYQRGMQVWDVRTRSLRWVGQPYQTIFRDVAWSPDGTRLASSGEDGSVYLWEGLSSAGQELDPVPTRLLGHHGWVINVVWSPDGTRLAGGSDGEGSGELFVWNVQKSVGAVAPCPLRVFAGHSGQVYAAVWSPSGDLLISGDTNGMLRWWDVESGECVGIREAHQGAIRSLKVSPNGRWLASCGDDGAIKICNLASFEHVRTLRQDRLYERLNITGIKGLTEAQKASLHTLGAIEETVTSRRQ